MITLTANSDCDQTGQYIARITGTNKLSVFNREFIGQMHGDQKTTTANIKEPGLFEIRNSTYKGIVTRYFMILDADGKLTLFPTRKHDVDIIAKRLDSGLKLDEIVRIANCQYAITELRKDDDSVNEDTLNLLSDQCWQIIQTVPAKQARKILSMLKTRLQSQTPTFPKTT